MTKDQTIAIWTREGPWGEHFDYPRCDWKDEVNSDYTNLGYWDWVYDQWESSRETTATPEVTDEEVRRAETVAAITELHNTEVPGTASEIYANWGASVGGFPGIWVYLARFGLELDAALGKEWESGDREFLDDVFAANKFLTEHLREHGFEHEPKELVYWFTEVHPSNKEDN